MAGTEQTNKDEPCEAVNWQKILLAVLGKGTLKRNALLLHHSLKIRCVTFYGKYFVALPLCSFFSSKLGLLVCFLYKKVIFFVNVKAFFTPIVKSIGLRLMEMKNSCFYSSSNLSTGWRKMFNTSANKNNENKKIFCLMVLELDHRRSAAKTVNTMGLNT